MSLRGKCQCWTHWGKEAPETSASPRTSYNTMTPDRDIPSWEIEEGSQRLYNEVEIWNLLEI